MGIKKAPQQNCGERWLFYVERADGLFLLLVEIGEDAFYVETFESVAAEVGGEEGHVFGIVLEEVFGEDSRAFCVLEDVEVGFEVIVAVGGVGAEGELVFAVLAEELACIEVFHVFGEVVACGGIETGGEEVGLGLSFCGVGAPASCGHPFLAVAGTIDVDRYIDAVFSAIHITDFIHALAAVTEFLFLLCFAGAAEEVGCGLQVGVVDEDEITEIFQFRLDGVDKVTGVISFAELAVGRGFARCCGEVGSAEDNYFFHCCCCFWLGDKIAENCDYTIFIFILLFISLSSRVFTYDESPIYFLVAVRVYSRFTVHTYKITT